MISKDKIDSIRSKLKQTGFFHIFCVSTINKIIAFVSSWILVRILSKSEYGVYTSSNNIYSFFLLLSGWGITSAVLQLCSETKDVGRQLTIYQYGMRFGLKVNSSLGIMIAFAGLFISLPIEGSNNLLVMMSGLPIVNFIPEMQLIFLRFKMRNKEYSKAIMFNSFILMPLSCVFAFVWKAPGLILASYLAHIITSFYLTRKNSVPIGIAKGGMNFTDRKAMLSIATISMLNNGLSRLMYLLDILVLGIAVPDSTIIASYKIATNIPTAMLFIPSALIIYVYPYFARNKGNKDWLIKSYRKIIFFFGLFNAFVSVGLVLFATPIIKIVYGAQYLDAVGPFKILSVSYFFSATFRSISGNLLVTQRKLKFNLLLAVLSSTMNTVLNVFLITKWASIGAAVATLITVLVGSLASTIYLIFTFNKR